MRAPELEELRRSFTIWLRQVLLPARVPGVQIPQMADLEEVKSMLAERVKEWTQEWKQEGFEEALEKGRSVLIQALEKRFGPLPEMSRKKVASLNSVETIVELSGSIPTAPSLAALGLD